MTTVIHPSRFKLQSCPALFLETASLGWDFSASLPVSAQRAFELVTDAKYECEWFPNFHSIRWSGAPAAGAKREYRLTYMRIVENVTVWEPGRHFQFWVSSCSLPLLQRFTEDYLFVSNTPESTQLHWRIRYEPRREIRLLHPLIAPFFARDFRLAVTRLEAVANRDVQRSRAA